MAGAEGTEKAASSDHCGITSAVPYRVLGEAASAANWKWTAFIPPADDRVVGHHNEGCAVECKIIQRLVVMQRRK